MSEDYEARAHKQLQIESWSNAARTLLIRGATDGGPFAEQHTTNADRSRATETFELHGRPTKLQISPSAAPVRRGECYVRATLLLDGEPVQRLSAGYLTDSKTLSWPPGVFEGFTEGEGIIRYVGGTNPAAGAEVAEVVPTNTRWRLISVFIRLTTDATVANRQAQIVIDDGTDLFYSIVAPIVTASILRNHLFIAGYSPLETAFDGNGHVRLPLPNLKMFQGYRITTNTINLQAGDDYAAPRMLVEEWIEE